MALTFQCYNFISVLSQNIYASVPLRIHGCNVLAYVLYIHHASDVSYGHFNNSCISDLIFFEVWSKINSMTVQLYNNNCITDMCNAVNCTPAETKPVRTDTVAREETETWSPLKAATVCLALLCFLLLTTVAAVGVLCEYSERESVKVRTERGRSCSDWVTLVACGSVQLFFSPHSWQGL